MYDSTGSIFSNGSNGYTIPNPVVATGGSHEGGRESAVISLSLSNRRQSRLLLEPIGVEGFPAPHLSAPALPPIKGEKRVRERNEEDLKHAIPRPRPGVCGGSPAPDANQATLAQKNIAAISQALNNGASVASFPGEFGDNGTDAAAAAAPGRGSHDTMIAANNAKNAAASQQQDDAQLKV